MRKMIFRGKRLDNGEWVYGHYVDYIHPDCGLPRPSIIYTLSDIGNMIVAVDPSTIGQFTGLYDRNGTDIYEGDILRGTLHNHVVKFKNGIFLAEVEDEYGYDCIKPTMFKATEVIGTIHDNPIEE